MKHKTLQQLFPLIFTMALGSFLTILYVTRNTSSDTQTEIRSSSPEKKPRNAFMIWQSLSRHLLSIDR